MEQRYTFTASWIVTAPFWACDETEYGIRGEKTPDLTGGQC